MVHLLMLVYVIALFFVLIPGQFYTVPVDSKYVNIVHALVFALIWQLTHKFVWQLDKDNFDIDFDFSVRRVRSENP